MRALGNIFQTILSYLNPLTASTNLASSLIPGRRRRSVDDVLGSSKPSDERRRRSVGDMLGNSQPSADRHRRSVDDMMGSTQPSDERHRRSVGNMLGRSQPPDEEEDMLSSRSMRQEM